MTDVHGKNSKIFIGPNEFTAQGKSLELNFAVDVADSTTFGEDAKTAVAGQYKSTISHKGVFVGNQSGWATYAHSMIGNFSNTPITVLVGTPAVGNTCYQGKIQQAKLAHPISIGDIIATEADYEIDGVLARAAILEYEIASPVGPQIGTGTLIGEGNNDNMLQVTYHVISTNVGVAAGSGTYRIQLQWSSNDVSGSYTNISGILDVTSGPISFFETLQGSSMQYLRVVTSRAVGNSGAASFVVTTAKVARQ